MPGTVTNETGLLGLVDAYSRKEGAAFQWQHYTLFTDKGPDSGGRDACQRFKENRVVPGEQWLWLVLIGSRDPMDYLDCPYPAVDPALGYLEVPIRPDGDPTTVTQDGNLYVGRGTSKTHSARCAGTSQEATGGWVRYTQLDDTTSVGSYQVTGAFGTFTGDFTAPGCVLTGPRPAKTTCAS